MKLLFLIVLFFPTIVWGYSAECYVVMDYDSGRVLMAHNEDRKKLIASTTKIMSAIVAIESSDLDSIRVVGREVLKAYGSAIYIREGEEISLRDLLYGLLLRSGNDAAIEIAYHVSGGMDEFVKLMNNKAYELGMNNTHFVNNHGLEEGGYANISTAFDMALLMRYAIDNDIFKNIINTKEYIVKTNYNTYNWINKNKLLFSYKKMIGGKTGYTKKAGRSLVTVSEDNKKKVIVVTLNDGDDFNDHKKMSEYVFNNYERVCFDRELNGYYIKNELCALMNRKERSKVNSKMDIYNTFDDYDGVIRLYIDNEYLMSTKVYSYKHIIKDNYIKRLIRKVFKW